MHNLKQQHSSKVILNRKWTHQAGVAGFLFFLIKGLIWIGAAFWMIY